MEQTAKKQPKKRIFSGIQPTGSVHLGNYLGAIRNWAALQDSYECLYSIVDLHSLTVRQDPKVLAAATRGLTALLIAAGLDPDKNILYIQSQVASHAQLAWILNCYAYMGELGRMTQYKEKSAKHEENVNVGLFAYPVLQAADILLYDSDLVPVGEDQRQHLELCRDVAVRFNNIYGEVFVIPEAYIAKAGAKVMSLGRPLHKMSKSDAGGENDIIYLLDTDEMIISKFKKAVTDSDNEVRLSDEKPGIANLMGIYGVITKKTAPEIEKEFAGVGYGAFKTAVAEAVIGEVSPIRKRYFELMEEPGYIDGVLAQNREKAREIAAAVLRRVHDTLGLIS